MISFPLIAPILLLLLVLTLLKGTVFSLSVATKDPSRSITSDGVVWQEVAIPTSRQEADNIDNDSIIANSEGQTLGERIKYGESVVLLNNLANKSECDHLVGLLCLSHHHHHRDRNTAAPSDSSSPPSLMRIPTLAAAERAAKTKTPCVPAMSPQADAICRSLLQRAMRWIDPRESPSAMVADALFPHRFTPLETLLLDNDPQLQWSSREPAVNLYTTGGAFRAHTDGQALTVLLSLTCPDTGFEGGGTAFWSQDSRGHRVEDPGLVLAPPVGTAIVFGGCVTHSGLPISSGLRSVLVASFSVKKQP